MKTHKVGVVGLGHGANHVGVLAALDRTECVAVCDVNESRLSAVAKAHGVSRTTRHFADLLGDADLDILCIATWTSLHASMTVAAAQAGVKGIFCEKPIATDLNQARKYSFFESFHLPFKIFIVAFNKLSVFELR